MDHVQSRLPYDVKPPAAIRIYASVAKPMIVGGNSMTAAAGFILASKGAFDGGRFMAAVSGIALVVAAGCVLNNCIDRDIDRKMARTRRRALADDQISVGAAGFYALMLGLAGLALLFATTNRLAVGVVLAGFGVYVGLYSLCLKSRSVHATLIGSLAGAAPPVAGYCAAGNGFDTGALILLLIFWLWQIPHSYAIGLFRSDDYAAAAIPVPPLKWGVPAARRHITAYIAAFTLAVPTLSLAGYTGSLFFVATLLTGLLWLWMARRPIRHRNPSRWAEILFLCSLLNLVVLSAMMVLDGQVG